MKCENCEVDHDGNYGSGRFCSSKCARGFSTKDKRKEINKKVSASLKGRKGIEGGIGHWKGKSLPEEHRKKIKKGLKSYYKSFNEKLLKEVPFEKLPTLLIKRTLFEEFENTCSDCGYEYTDPKTGKGPFEIHHIDGNNKNWKKENLKIVCLNCHWKTKNYRFNGRKHTQETKDKISKMFKGFDNAPEYTKLRRKFKS